MHGPLSPPNILRSSVLRTLISRGEIPPSSVQPDLYESALDDMSTGYCISVQLLRFYSFLRSKLYRSLFLSGGFLRRT